MLVLKMAEMAARSAQLTAHVSASVLFYRGVISRENAQRSANGMRMKRPFGPHTHTRRASTRSPPRSIYKAPTPLNPLRSSPHDVEVARGHSIEVTLHLGLGRSQRAFCQSPTSKVAIVADRATVMDLDVTQVLGHT